MRVIAQTPCDDSRTPPLKWIGDALPLAPFDVAGWKAGDLKEKMRIAALSWVEVGFGAPRVAYTYYLLKHAFWVYMWTFFVTYSEAARFDSAFKWHGLATLDAMQRLVIWNLLFEALGLGCASGPLTGKFLNQFPALMHWLWPGTMKMPYRIDLRDGQKPLLPGAGTSRTLLDVVLYVAFIAACLRALTSTQIGPAECVPIIALLLLIGLLDYTIYLAARSEVYLYMIVCFCFLDASDPPAEAAVLTALKVIQLGIWIWAGVSKWGAYPVVLCCEPIQYVAGRNVHYALFKNAPTDLRCSTLCWLLAHAGTATEAIFPCMLALGGSVGYLSSEGSLVGQLGLFICLGFHAFIFSQVAMGAPQEWNIFTAINACFLFGLHGGVNLSDLAALPTGLIVFLLVAEVGLPVLGNLKAKYVSFLTAMRYYAGNWPISIWLIKRKAYHKLDKVKSASGMMHDVVWNLYGTDGVITCAEAKLLAWISMHVQGRLLPKLIPKAIGDAKNFDEYQFFLGETLAGFALGYNFGDGYLHGPFFMNEFQKRCQFEEGECVQIFIDSCSLGGDHYPWWIKDATDAFGHVEKGEGAVTQLVNTQPF